MSGDLGLAAALAASETHRALYEEGSRRAFVSQRNANFDLGVRSDVGKVTRIDQSSEALHAILAQHGIPNDSGWKSS